MSESGDDGAAERPRAEPRRRRRRRSHRGLFARLGFWLELGAEVRDAAIALLRAEARLARAALPQLLVWLAVLSLGGVLLLATLWGGLLYLLYHWTGSLGESLLWLAAASTVVTAGAAFFLREAVRAASFAESRRRIGHWLERSESHDRAGRETAD
ncbi:hypothetical protein [Tahibacter harae]|uniref:Membrane protein YqjE n=1 Tax=Tahibacter harae TaxID=2963937 RepID=A0ABT1QW47_9GAMM|nr:hypothetical protein [Tahibacter harae]MCQ4166505.1 hypothetical protein [Tahibacter harae]